MKNIYNLLFCIVVILTLTNNVMAKSPLKFRKSIVSESVISENTNFKPFVSAVIPKEKDIDCTRWKPKMVAGGTLIGVGALALGGGLGLCIWGIEDFDIWAYATGALIGGAGTMMIIFGGPLLAKGIRHRSKCKQEEAQSGSLYLVPKPNGLGLSFKF